MTKDVIEQLPWYSVEGKKTINNLLSNFKKEERILRKWRMTDMKN